MGYKMLSFELNCQRRSQGFLTFLVSKVYVPDLILKTLWDLIVRLQWSNSLLILKPEIMHIPLMLYNNYYSWRDFYAVIYFLYF